MRPKPLAIFPILALFLLLLLPLSACSAEQSARDQVRELQERFQTSTQRFSAHITADYGELVYEFTLRFDSAAGTLEVLAPDILAGISIGISESGTVLHYEGAMLNTGPLTEDGLSPLAALPAIVRQWREGFVTQAHYETFQGIPVVVMTSHISDHVLHMTRFDRETGIPVQAEIVAEGFVVLSCIFEGSPLFSPLG